MIFKKKIYSIMVIGIMSLCVIAGCGKSDERYEEALKLFNEESYVEACEVIQEAIGSNKDKADYYILYGMALTGCADYENAREQFITVVQEKENIWSDENNKNAYRGIALTYYEQGVYDQAKAYFELALETDALSEMDNDLRAYCAECELYLGDYKEAKEIFTELIESKKGDKKEIVGYYVGRANTYMILGEYMEAADDYQAAIDKYSECYPAYIGKYLALINTHDENSANEFLQNAIETVKKNEEEIFYLAVLEYYNGNDDSSLEMFTKLKEEDNKEADYYIGLIRQRQGQFMEALACYEEYMTNVPTGKNAEICNQIAGCYMALEDYEMAAKYLEDGILLSGGNMKQEILKNCIVAYEKWGNYGKALEYAEEYVSQYDDPDMKNEYKFLKTRYKEQEEGN